MISLVRIFPSYEYMVTYSTVDQYSRCWQFGAIMENTVVNELVHVSWSHVYACLLEIYLEMEFLFHRLYIDSILEVNGKRFPEVVAPIYVPSCL